MTQIQSEEGPFSFVLLVPTQFLGTVHLLNIVLQGFHVDVVVLYKGGNIFHLVIDIGVVLS